MKIKSSIDFKKFFLLGLNLKGVQQILVQIDRILILVVYTRCQEILAKIPAKEYHLNVVVLG